MSGNSEKVSHKSSYTFLYLITGAILLAISNGRWIIPVAAWLAPVFLLRFLRIKKPLSGLIVGALVFIPVSLLMWLKMLIPVKHGVFPVLLIAGLALYQYLPYVIDRLVSIRLNGFVSTLVFPLACTSMEYTLSLLNPYATFGSLGYTQYGNLPLMQLASVTGIWGIIFLMTWFASVVNWIWESNFLRIRCTKAISIYGTIFILVLLLGGARMALFAPDDNTVRIASITRSADYSAKLRGSVHLRDRQLVSMQERDHLLDLSLRAARLGAKIVFWQEYAIVYVDDENSFIEPGRELAKKENIYLGMAFSTVARNSRGDPAGPSEPATPPQNKIIMIAPSGEIAWQYAKANPVPGEGIAPGDGEIHSLMTPYGKIASVICFDLDFPDYIRQAGADDVDILLAPALDWKEIYPLSTHLTVFRALENGFSLVRAAGNGLSIAVDYYGQTRSTADYYTDADRVMIADLPTSGVPTLYSIIADLFAWFSLAALIVFIVIAFIRKPNIL
jgi:apolipoprotein N-acyltransferase